LCRVSNTATLPVAQSGGLAAAQAHVARTVCRRAERAVVAVNHVHTPTPATPHTDDAAAAAAPSSPSPPAAVAPVVQPDVTRFLNRLSDYLFVLARHLSAQVGAVEAVYKKDAGVTLRPLEAPAVDALHVQSS